MDIPSEILGFIGCHTNLGLEKGPQQLLYGAHLTLSSRETVLICLFGHIAIKPNV